jgi:hypothetical protein
LSLGICLGAIKDCVVGDKKYNVWMVEEVSIRDLGTLPTAVSSLHHPRPLKLVTFPTISQLLQVYPFSRVSRSLWRTFSHRKF